MLPLQAENDGITLSTRLAEIYADQACSRTPRPEVWASLFLRERGRAGISGCEGYLYQPNRPWGVRESTDRSKCVSTDTELLTIEGWKTFDLLREGDQIYSTDETGTLVEDKIASIKVHGGPSVVIEFSQKYAFNMVVTPGHRCVIQSQHSKKPGYSDYRFVETDNLAKRHQIPRRPESIDVDQIEVLEDDEVCLLAWVASEGSYYRDPDKYRKLEKVTIHQSERANPEHCEEIQGLFDRICQGSTFVSNRCRTWNLTGWGRELALTYLPEKQISGQLMRELSPRQMEIFLKTFIKGDGNDYHGDGDKWVIAQKDRSTLKELQAMATVCGYTTTLRNERKDGASRLYITEHTKRTQVGPLDKKRRIWEHGVWSPTTSTGRWIARRNGAVFITGNST